MDEEVERFLRDAATLPERYDEIRAAAEAAVVEWRWTTGHVHEFELPHQAELTGWPPARLVRTQPKRGPATRVGLDAHGRRVAILLHGNGLEEDTTNERLAVDEDTVAGFAFFRPSWVPPSEQLDGTSLERLVRDATGRPIRRLRTAADGHWDRDQYVYDEAGRCVAVHRYSSEYGGWRFEAFHGPDGRLQRIDSVPPDGTRQPAWVRLDVPLGQALEQLEAALAEHVGAILEREPSLWALALAYEAEAPLPPHIVTCTVRERRSWSPDADWWLTNPAEWNDEGRPPALAAELEELGQAVALTLQTRGGASKGVGVLHSVARQLNTGPVLVFAREIHGEREERDLRASLPEDRFAQLKTAGII